MIELIQTFIARCTGFFGITNSSSLLPVIKMVVYLATIPYDIAVVAGAFCGNLGVTIYSWF